MTSETPLILLRSDCRVRSLSNFKETKRNLQAGKFLNRATKQRFEDDIFSAFNRNAMRLRKLKQIYMLLFFAAW